MQNTIESEPLFRTAARSEGPLARFVRQAVQQYKRRTPGHGQKSLFGELAVQTRQHKIEWHEAAHPPQSGRMTEASTVREQLRAAKAIRDAKRAEEDASNAAEPGDRQRAKEA